MVRGVDNGVEDGVDDGVADAFGRTHDLHLSLSLSRLNRQPKNSSLKLVMNLPE